jgi:hypothetical protein
MTKTLEAPQEISRETKLVTEEQLRMKAQEQIDSFKMPVPPRGQSILWYPSGLKSSKAEIGFVLRVGARNIVINLASGLARESVRHVDDPKLQTSVEQREGGAWDFTDDWKEIQALRKDVTELKKLVQDLMK